MATFLQTSVGGERRDLTCVWGRVPGAGRQCVAGSSEEGENVGLESKPGTGPRSYEAHSSFCSFMYLIYSFLQLIIW